MSVKRYNPCTEKNDPKLFAKQWELVRRNQAFRDLIDRAVINPVTKEDCEMSRTWISRAVASIASDTSCGSMREIYCKPWPDLAPDLKEFLRLYHLDALMEPMPIVVVDPMDPREYEPKGIEVISSALGKAELQRFYTVLVPKSVPDPATRDRFVNQIKGIISCRHQSAKVHSPSGSNFGAMMDWEVYLKVERLRRDRHLPTAIRHDGDPNWEEFVDAVMDDDGKNSLRDRSSRTTDYQNRYLKIRKEIRDAFGPKPF